MCHFKYGKWQMPACYQQYFGKHTHVTSEILFQLRCVFNISTLINFKLLLLQMTNFVHVPKVLEQDILVLLPPLMQCKHTWAVFIHRKWNWWKEEVFVWSALTMHTFIWLWLICYPRMYSWPDLFLLWLFLKLHQLFFCCDLLHTNLKYKRLQKCPEHHFKTQFLSNFWQYSAWGRKSNNSISDFVYFCSNHKCQWTYYIMTADVDLVLVFVFWLKWIETEWLLWCSD